MTRTFVTETHLEQQIQSIQSVVIDIQSGLLLSPELAEKIRQNQNLCNQFLHHILRDVYPKYAAQRKINELAHRLNTLFGLKLNAAALTKRYERLPVDVRTAPREKPSVLLDSISFKVLHPTQEPARMIFTNDSILWSWELVGHDTERLAQGHGDTLDQVLPDASSAIWTWQHTESICSTP